MTLAKGPSLIRQVRRALRRVEPRLIPAEARRQAGVMLLLYELDGRTHLLFTRRTELVEHHKGQICFPGGRYEEGDADLLQTALRETLEEVGVRSEDVEPLGRLDDIVARVSNFVMSPFVGLISGPLPYPFDHARHEVDEILEVPLDWLLDEANAIREIQHFDGEPVEVISYRHGQNVIWGATARILKQFLELIRREQEQG